MVAIYHHAVTIGVLTCDIWLCYVHGRSYKVSVLQSTLVMVTDMSFSDGERKTEVKKYEDIKLTVIVCGLVVLFVSIASMLCVAYWKNKRLPGIIEVAILCFKEYILMRQMEFLKFKRSFVWKKVLLDISEIGYKIC